MSLGRLRSAIVSPRPRIATWRRFVVELAGCLFPPGTRSFEKYGETDADILSGTRPRFRTNRTVLTMRGNDAAPPPIVTSSIKRAESKYPRGPRSRSIRGSIHSGARGAVLVAEFVFKTVLPIVILALNLNMRLSIYSERDMKIDV